MMKRLDARVFGNAAIARENPDPNVQAFWVSVLRKDDVPTPEEVIPFVIERECELRIDRV